MTTGAREAARFVSRIEQVCAVASAMSTLGQFALADRLDSTSAQAPFTHNAALRATNAFHSTALGDLADTTRSASTTRLFGELMCAQALVAAHAVSEPYRTGQSPLLEFLRHVRNGCAHGNRFRFDGNEPRSPASFDVYVIDVNLQGAKVVGFTDGFIGQGEVLALLSAVSQHLDGLSPNRRCDRAD